MTAVLLMMLDNKLKNYVENSFTNPDGNLYHYTNCLSSIVSSGYLQLSLHHALNNRGHQELSIGKKLVTLQMRKFQGLLCLKKQFINQLIEQEHAMLLSKVIYDHRKQRKIIRKIFELYNQSSENQQDKIESLFLWISIVIPLFKRKKFHLENECRFVNAEIYSPNSKNLATTKCAKKFPLENWGYFIKT